jgi:hypothetical protein
MATFAPLQVVVETPMVAVFEYIVVDSIQRASSKEPFMVSAGELTVPDDSVAAPDQLDVEALYLLYNRLSDELV